MAIAVDIIISDTELVPQPIEGVIVQVYDYVLGDLIAQATSDDTGTAAFLLPGAAAPSPLPYEVRFFKLGVLFNNPMAIAVEEPLSGTDTNNFTVSGQLTSVVSQTAVATIVSATGGATVGTQTLFTTAADHGFSVGQIVAIAGVSDSTFNGSWTISSIPAPTTFTINQVLYPVVHNGTGGTATVSFTTLQPATDPRLCRIQGRFMNLSNQPIPNSTFRIMARAQTGAEAPKYVDDQLISASEMSFKTDQNGYAVAELFRTGHFEIMFAGEDDTEWPFYVPDTPFAQWGDLINPYPVSIAWSPTIAPDNAVGMLVGQSLFVPFTAIFSNTQSPLSGLSLWLNFFSSDTTNMIIGLQQADMGVNIISVGPGVVTITGANKPCLLPPRIPYYDTVIPPLTVTVT
jgi:hypothetical protein